MRPIWIPALLLLPVAGAPAQETSPADAEFYAAKIRPLLEARCFKCHGPEAKAKGGFRLDTRELILKGGDSGPAVVPGDPAKSPLIAAVRRADPETAMPPKEKDALPAGEVALLVDWVQRGLPYATSHAKPARKEKPIRDEDRAWWAFQPVKAPALPPDDPWCRTPLDRFILAKLRAEGLAPAPEADRVAFIRRVTFDLHGLPPTPEEVDAFVKDGDVEKLVDRLLASPRYGERWARHWLDLVRYAESDGYKQDGYRPAAWPYRDYVVRAFNEDMPYDRFVREQLAGDEIAPEDPTVFVATGFLRHGIYEYNQRDAPGQWRDILNDITDVTGDVFLGLGMGCAKCHDHKFDPILQRDYYQLRSFFAALRWRSDGVLATPDQTAAYEAKKKIWEQRTAEIREKIAEIERPHLAAITRNTIGKFTKEFQAIYYKPAAERTAYETQIADLMGRQVYEEGGAIDGKIKGAQREKWSELKRRLAEHDADRPKEPQAALIVGDVSAEAPPMAIPNGPDVRPAFLTVLGGEVPGIVPGPGSTGRRTALAAWLTRPDHPLTARVLVNRIWQQHFGKGLSAVSSDFGRLGEAPSHPELLDWMASDVVARGWTLKRLHRMILTSATYRQSSVHPDAAAGRLKDPEARWLWRFPVRRLSAEEIRDAMLSTSGELDPAMGGPSVDTNQPRRTLYTKQLRNIRDPLLEAFDLPQFFTSEGSRNSTTTATQALLMINNRWPLERAEAFAKRLRKSADPVGEAWRLAYGRGPSKAERDAALAFLEKSSPQANASASELPLTQVMPDRGGQAARIRGNHPEDRLRLATTKDFPSGDFTIEAIVVLDSLFEDAAVRTIASCWEGKETLPGWSFGVTSEKSKHQPRNLILQLIGDQGYEVIPSDLRLALHKTHYVSVSVKLADTGPTGVTFTMLDLSDPEATLRTASVKHKTTSGYAAKNAPFAIGGREGQAGHGWDGLIDDVRLTRRALSKGELLIDDAPGKDVAGHWTFEGVPGFFAESEGRQDAMTRPALKAVQTSEAGLVDFCHVILNSNRFLYVD
jgi:mono/diheme cytochrome c family protein